MPAIFRLFDIFALIYVLRGLQLSVTIWRQRQQIRQPPLTWTKKHLAEQASFFIAVPIGVFVHEFGHAAATWLFGGRVVEFGYRAFWGYVLPEGSFTPTQDWFISLAGTLGSLAFGIGIWLLFRTHRNQTLRYFGLRAFRFQVFFALVYYPVFTLIGFVGDWRTIYDFGATPVASGMTALLHLGTLLLFRQRDRAGWFEMAAHETTEEEERFGALAQEVENAPHDADLRLRYIEMLRRGGAVNKAKSQLGAYLEQFPDSGAGYLQLALMQSGRGSQSPRRAIENAGKALELGLPNEESEALAHQMIGKYHLELGRAEQALTHLNLAINLATRLQADAAYRAQLHHWRGQAYRRLRQYESAVQDVHQAVALAAAHGDEKLAAFFRSEIEVLEQHAGRSLENAPVSAPTKEEVMTEEGS